MKEPRVIPATPEELIETPLGRPADANRFLSRFVLLSGEVCQDSPVHVAVHLIKDLEGPPEPYVKAHRHPTCDEIGLVLGQPGALEYEVILDGEVHKIVSPAGVFIPAGTTHRARAMRGNGAYACVLMDPKGPHPSNIAADHGE